MALAWTARPGLPADPESGLGVVVTQFRADMGPQTFEKLLLEGAVVEQLVVGATTGYWVEGGQHLFYFRDADGNVVDATIRLVGTTLMWERDGYTVRIEGAPDAGDGQADRRVDGAALGRIRGGPSPHRRQQQAGQDGGRAQQLHRVRRLAQDQHGSSTAPTGWRVSTTLVSAAGRRGSERLISSQPTTCDERASASR